MPGVGQGGAGVVIADIDLPAAEETKGLIEKAGGRALAVKVDVADEKSTLEMAETLLNAHRRVRTASRIKGIRYRVEPHLPPDVLGIYVYLPVA